MIGFTLFLLLHSLLALHTRDICQLPGQVLLRASQEPWGLAYTDQTTPAPPASSAWCSCQHSEHQLGQRRGTGLWTPLLPLPILFWAMDLGCKLFCGEWAPGRATIPAPVLPLESLYRDVSLHFYCKCALYHHTPGSQHSQSLYPEPKWSPESTGGAGRSWNQLPIMRSALLQPKPPGRNTVRSSWLCFIQKRHWGLCGRLKSSE